MRFDGASTLVLAFALGAGAAGVTAAAQELPDAPVPSAAPAAAAIFSLPRTLSYQFADPFAAPTWQTNLPDRDGMAGQAAAYFLRQGGDEAFFDFSMRRNFGEGYFGRHFAVTLGLLNGHFSNQRYAERMKWRSQLGLQPGERSGLIDALVPALAHEGCGGGPGGAIEFTPHIPKP